MMNKIMIEINTRNAAFEEDRVGEIARILRDLATRIEGGEMPDELPVRDINGNTVGFLMDL